MFYWLFDKVENNTIHKLFLMNSRWPCFFLKQSLTDDKISEILFWLQWSKICEWFHKNSSSSDPITSKIIPYGSEKNKNKMNHLKFDFTWNKNSEKIKKIWNVNNELKLDKLREWKSMLNAKRCVLGNQLILWDFVLNINQLCRLETTNFIVSINIRM